MNIHVNDQLRQQIKERRARLGYVPVSQPVPVNLVRPQPVKIEVKKEDQIDLTKYQTPLTIIDQQKTYKENELAIDPPLDQIKQPRINSIIIAVANEFELSKYQIIGPRRHGNLCKARHIACYLAREMTNHSLPMIAKYMGGRDHTTILNSFNRAQELIEKDPDLRKRVDHIKAELIREAQ